MDLLYITKKAVFDADDMEFRWSLRSIARYGKNIDRIFVVGWCPDWLSDDIIKIPYESNIDPNNEIAKNWDIAKKLLFAAENSDISEEFLVSMDDHFYVKETDFDNYPYYASRTNGGALPTKRAGSVYNKMMYDFGKFLEEKNLPTIYFTLHRNMHVSKSSLNACMEIIKEAENNGKPMEIFTLLNNYRFSKGEITPTIVKDIKLFNGGDWYLVGSGDGVFSTSNTALYEGLFVLMDGMFPNKCKYEKNQGVEQKKGDDLRVAIFCICKHEENYIDEWIDYHLKLGADDLYILDNNVFGNDAMKDIIVRRNNEHIKYIDIRGYKFYQAKAYNKLYAQVRSKYDWIAFIDADEFIEFEDKEATIKSFLKSNYKFSLADQVRLCWKVYDDNDLIDVEGGNYSVTRFKRTITKDLRKSRSRDLYRQCKSFINTKYGGKVDIHGIYGNRGVSVDCFGDTCWGNYIFIGPKPLLGIAWVNHYRMKTIGEYVRYKMYRGNAEAFIREYKYDTLEEFWSCNIWTQEKEDHAKELLNKLYSSKNK